MQWVTPSLADLLQRPAAELQRLAEDVGEALSIRAEEERRPSPAQGEAAAAQEVAPETRPILAPVPGVQLPATDERAGDTAPPLRAAGEVFWTRHGNVWHSQYNCRMLQCAKRISSGPTAPLPLKGACFVCAGRASRC